MAAHLRDLPAPGCDWLYCLRPAKKELRNTFNAIIAMYCGTHAEKALRDFQREEGET